VGREGGRASWKEFASREGRAGLEGLSNPTWSRPEGTVLLNHGYVERGDTHDQKDHDDARKRKKA